METIYHVDVDEEEKMNNVDTHRLTFKPSRSFPSSPSIFPLQIPTPPSLRKNPEFIFVVTENTAHACQFPSSTHQKPVLVVFESRGLKSFAPCTLYGGSTRLIGGQLLLDALDSQQYSISSPLFKNYCVWSIKVNNQNHGEWTNYFETSLINQVVVILYERNSHNFLSLEKLVDYSAGDDNNNGVNLAVVALFPHGGLMFWSSQCQSSGWKPIITTTTTTTCKNRFDDIVNYQGKCWAIDRDGETFVLDTKSLCIIHVASLPKETSNLVDKGRKRLVAVSRELYMLYPCMDRGYNCKSNIIKVFQMKESGWVEVSSLGNYNFFVGERFACGFLARRELWFSKEEILKYNDGNCIFLEGMSFCRKVRTWFKDDLKNDDYPLFKEMSEIKGPIFGVYEKVCDKFKVISRRDLPELFCGEIFRNAGVRPRRKRRRTFSFDDSMPID